MLTGIWVVCYLTLWASRCIEARGTGLKLCETQHMSARELGCSGREITVISSPVI